MTSTQRPNHKITKETLEQLRQENLARRAAHPGWPTHKTTIHYPHGRTELVSETVPIKKIKHKGYCKYCYQTHGNWWLMDQRDYEVEGLTIILCGECEYTSGMAYT
jgi:DNA-directed RNA polymerase subunit M/transcription elongation factor TFIIS